MYVFLFLLYRCTVPLYRCTVPLYRCTVPLYRCTVPLYRCTVPLYRCTVPLYRYTVPLKSYQPSSRFLHLTAKLPKPVDHPSKTAILSMALRFVNHLKAKNGLCFLSFHCFFLSRIKTFPTWNGLLQVSDWQTMPLDRSAKEAIQVWSRHTMEVVKLVKLIPFSSHEYLKIIFCLFVFCCCIVS